MFVLPCALSPSSRCKPGVKIHVQPRVIAEVPESQMGQMHAAKMNRKGNRREFFRQGQTSRSDSRRKLPVEILVMANPNPDPQVAVQSLGNGAIIPGYAHRPKARVRTAAVPVAVKGGPDFAETFCKRRARASLAPVGKRAISLPEEPGVPSDFTGVDQNRITAMKVGQ